MRRGSTYYPAHWQVSLASTQLPPTGPRSNSINPLSLAPLSIVVPQMHSDSRGIETAATITSQSADLREPALPSICPKFHWADDYEVLRNGGNLPNNPIV
jgi:hypothetical protein